MLNTSSFGDVLFDAPSRALIDRHTSALASNLRVIRDLVCDLVGILHPGSGLIRPRGRTGPAQS
jgi:hypothetical protein